jgi:hypothetical protein
MLRKQHPNKKNPSSFFFDSGIKNLSGNKNLAYALVLFTESISQNESKRNSAIMEFGSGIHQLGLT